MWTEFIEIYSNCRLNQSEKSHQVSQYTQTLDIFPNKNNLQSKKPNSTIINSPLLRGYRQRWGGLL